MVVGVKLMHIITKFISQRIVQAAPGITFVQQFPGVDIFRVTPACLQVTPPGLLQPANLGQFTVIAIKPLVPWAYLGIIRFILILTGWIIRDGISLVINPVENPPILFMDDGSQLNVILIC